MVSTWAFIGVCVSWAIMFGTSIVQTVTIRKLRKLLLTDDIPSVAFTGMSHRTSDDDEGSFAKTTSLMDLSLEQYDALMRHEAHLLMTNFPLKDDTKED